MEGDGRDGFRSAPRRRPSSWHAGRQHLGTSNAPRFMTGLVMCKLTMAEALAELIFGLVMQRYPDLKFIAVEAQIGWISFVEYYMDHLWEKHRYWTKSELKEPPSTISRQVFATFMEDPVGLREREHIGIDNIMWASDYPHSETTWPNSKTDRRVVHAVRRRGQGEDSLAELRQAVQADLTWQLSEEGPTAQEVGCPSPRWGMPFGRRCPPICTTDRIPPRRSYSSRS